MMFVVVVVVHPSGPVRFYLPTSGHGHTTLTLSTPPPSAPTEKKAMAGLLSYHQPPPLLQPLHRRGDFRRRSRVLAGSQESPSSMPSLSTVTSGEEEEKSVASASSPTLSPPTGFKIPDPKPFAVRPDKNLDIATATLPLLFRLGTGIFVQGYSATLVSDDDIPSNEYAMKVRGSKLKETSKLGPRPQKPIEIYEFESCPYCRKVREIVSILDLDVLFYPCPRSGPTFRPKVLQMGGKQQFPYMVDPNTGVAMYESDDIIKYLVDKYGDGTIPLMLSLGPITTLTAMLALIFRLGKARHFDIVPEFNANIMFMDYVLEYFKGFL